MTGNRPSDRVLSRDELREWVWSNPEAAALEIERLRHELSLESIRLRRVGAERDRLRNAAGDFPPPDPITGYEAP